MYVCMYVFMYVCMYVCMYVYIANVYDYVVIVDTSYQCMDAYRCLASQVCRVFLWYCLVRLSVLRVV